MHISQSIPQLARALAASLQVLQQSMPFIAATWSPGCFFLRQKYAANIMHDATNAAMQTYPPVVSRSFSALYLKLKKNRAPPKNAVVMGIVHARHVIAAKQFMPFCCGLWLIAKGVL